MTNYIKRLENILNQEDLNIKISLKSIKKFLVEDENFDDDNCNPRYYIIFSDRKTKDQYVLPVEVDKDEWRDIANFIKGNVLNELFNERQIDRRLIEEKLAILFDDEYSEYGEDL
jgi:hypothetical protein